MSLIGSSRPSYHHRNESHFCLSVTLVDFWGTYFLGLDQKNVGRKWGDCRYDREGACVLAGHELRTEDLGDVLDWRLWYQALMAGSDEGRGEERRNGL